MYDVFVSYARSERERAEPIKLQLEALGLSVFFDIEGIDGGDNFPDVINEALRGSKAVLACWSPTYFTRPWCMIECRHGRGKNKLVPVSSHALHGDDVPPDLEQINYLDLSQWNGEAGDENWRRTLRALGRLVGRELTPGLGVEPGPARTPATRPAPAPSTAFDPARYVFVSYPKDIDAALMRAIVRAIVARGVGVWIYNPQPFRFEVKELESMQWMAAGENFEAHAFDALSRAKCVVALVGRSTLSSRFQMKEIAEAARLGRAVPVIVDDLPFEEAPAPLKGVYAMRVTAQDVDQPQMAKHMAMLAQNVASWADSPGMRRRKRGAPLWIVLGLAGAALIAGAVAILYFLGRLG